MKSLLPLLLGLCALIVAPASALTVAELTAIHDQRGEPYRLRSFTIDDEWRRGVADDLRRLAPDVRQEIMTAAASRFDGAQIHIFHQDDTSLISYVAALEVDGEIVLMTWHSTAFFERSSLVERRIGLLDAILQAFDPQRFPAGWAESTFGASIENIRAWADDEPGARDGLYPGWTYENRGGIQSLGNSIIPDWVEITVTSLDCPPRYPLQGWAVQFFCVAP